MIPRLLFQTSVSFKWLKGRRGAPCELSGRSILSSISSIYNQLVDLASVIIR